MKTLFYKGFALIFFLSVTLSPLTATAQDSATQPTEPAIGEEAGYGVGSVLANVFYMPAKVTYAGLGLITGGLGFVLSAGRADVANNIIYPAVRGNYVITPSHLKGQEPVYFVGAPPPEAPPSAEVYSAAPTAQR
jgi:hypothetical protein